MRQPIDCSHGCRLLEAYGLSDPIFEKWPLRGGTATGADGCGDPREPIVGEQSRL